MDKPFTSIDEQIELLRSRGMVVNASDAHILEHEGYYPALNGYKDIFMNHLGLGQAFKFYDHQPEPMRNAVAKQFTDPHSKTHSKTECIHDKKLRLVYDHG